jgi:membrane peptidoglycan carboxypeptidase
MKKKQLRLLYRILFFTLFGSAVFLFFMFIQDFLRLDKITEIPQSTIIQDRTWKELFRFFEEDRYRLTYDEISPHMIDAIIAVEDQTFRENNGTDKSGLIRAIIANLKVRIYNEGQLQGWSTITQQLVKNIYLTKEKTISRKLQELVLAQQLTRKRIGFFRDQGLSKQEAQRKTKESLVTAYLNYVFFGNRSYGIDAAARHYFQTTAKELTILQSAILAALPQAPSIYNPSVNQESIMGYWLISPPMTGDENALSLNMSWSELVYDLLVEKPFTIKRDCLTDLMDRATVWSGDFQAVYQQWRKDRVLCRMWETKKISEQELISEFLAAKDIVFHTPRYSINAPHFVFWIQQRLLWLPQFVEKSISYEQLSQWGYTVITTLDGDLQTAGEQSLLNYRSWLQRLWGNNRALVHIDSSNGDVLTYIWSTDFYDEEIDGQVDVLRSIRQTGSTLKPFFYAYLLTHYPFTIRGNIVDFPLSKTWPNNHDGRFWGRTTIAWALAWSRNLPVVRIFLALWGAQTFVPYLQSLWFTSLDSTKKEYGYPLALGADEATLLQLAQWYLQLSTTWTVYPEINPIQRIIWPDGNMVYEKQPSRLKKIIPDTVAEMIWRILENPSNMPTEWRWLRNLPVKNLALKTGTSDIKVNGDPRPRDGVSVIYTPRDVIISRAGNTDGKAMWPKAFGGEINHYPIREYLQAAVDQEKIVDQPRITVTHYHPEGRYAWATSALTKDQEQILWRGTW